MPVSRIVIEDEGCLLKARFVGSTPEAVIGGLVVFGKRNGGASCLRIDVKLCGWRTVLRAIHDLGSHPTRFFRRQRMIIPGNPSGLGDSGSAGEVYTYLFQKGPDSRGVFIDVVEPSVYVR